LTLTFFENAKKRNAERLSKEQRTSAILHLQKEIEMFSKMQGFWEQEKRRAEIGKKYSK